MNQGFLLAWAQALGLYNEAARTPDLSRRKLALRKAVAGQQVLLIADSVCTPEDADIHKLEGDCVHLFTTRFPQIALQAATAPSRAIEAKELQPEEGIKLLASYAPTAVVHHRKSVAKIVEAIGALPLALGLIGRDLQRNAHGPPKRIRHALERILSARIADSLDAVVYWSLHGLTRNELAALLCLSVFRPKPNTFDDQAALAVSDAIDETLYRLLDAGLLEFVGSDHDDLQQDRYTLHQTIQEHTSRCLAEDASLETMAYSRLIGPYVTLLEAKATSSARRAAEVVNINAALNRAPQKEGYDRLLVRGANAYADFLLVRGLNDLSTGFLRSALNAYQRLNDPLMRADTSLNLAFHLEKLGEYTEADRYLNENEGQIVLGEPTRAARMYYVRAVIAYNLGEFSRAEESVCRGIEVLGLSPLDRFCGHLTRLSASNAAPKFTGILCRLLERRSITHLALDDIQRARQDWVDGIRIARHSSDQLGITVQRPLSLQERSA